MARKLMKTAVPSVFALTTDHEMSPQTVPKAEHNEKPGVKCEVFCDLTNTQELDNVNGDLDCPQMFEEEMIDFVEEIVISSENLDMLEENDSNNALENCSNDTLENVSNVTLENDSNNALENCSNDTLENVSNVTMEIETGISNTATQTPKCAAIYSVDGFKNDDPGIHYYTGLESYSKFLLVLNTLGPAAHRLNYVNQQEVTISVYDQFFLVLMKLRRHKINFELSILFGVSESAVSNIFLTWIIFMYKQWKELDLMSDRDLVRHFSPPDFQAKFPSTRLIIDVIECPVKRPKAPEEQKTTFSSYKHRTTVKTLIGSTPGGLISFVSPAYGGSTSDHEIVETESSNLVESCDPGDSIMVDKRLKVEDLFTPSGVFVKDRKNASNRVHGLRKKYKILTEPMTRAETKLASEIIFVCFMLCNFHQ